MGIPAILKNKWLLLGVVAGAGIFMFMRKDSGAATLSPAEIMGYDKDLIAMGQQTALERDKLDAQLKIATLSANTELAGKKADNETALGMLTLTTNADLEAIKTNADLTRYIRYEDAVTDARRFDMQKELGLAGIFSTERVRGAELATENSIAAATLQTQQFVAQQSAWASVESAKAEASGKVGAAKAGKSKGLSCCGFGLSF